ncbi:hypothetical protein [Amycolatopsis sp.]|uniref:hypothetical protein n=1 Tax=Amycolatopsis sp. TaxID=37632 RepID=UPI002C31DB18|nr:hypothetical protein [Amycolatopsis sp.]HVV12178.1 hypothetical protein [Amycolatopsis sp.]
MVRLDGFGCFYCGLPVRFNGARHHPGQVVIEHVSLAPPGPDGLPDLKVLHRFCSRVMRCGHESSVMLRRAWLGWATGEYESWQREKRYGTRHYLRLGVHSGGTLFRKHWRVRKMRCAAYACRYYTACHRHGAAADRAGSATRPGYLGVT